LFCNSYTIFGAITTGVTYGWTTTATALATAAFVPFVRASLRYSCTICDNDVEGNIFEALFGFMLLQILDH